MEATIATQVETYLDALSTSGQIASRFYIAQDKEFQIPVDLPRNSNLGPLSLVETVILDGVPNDETGEIEYN